MKRGALRQLAAWDAAGLKVPRMAVNISARQFMVSGLLGSVRAALAETGTSPERLELELTESTVAHNLTGNIHLGDLLAQLTELRGLGVRLALDDFGTGHSSLSLLRAVPAHTLKIDQTFVAGLPTDAESGAVVRMVLALARSLGLDVVAEGVETQGQWQTLSGLGCSVGQGYLFSRPLSAEQVPA